MDLREALAAYAHDSWSGWMKHLFSVCGGPDPSGEVVIPPELVKRWQRQMKTPYSQLPEEEKESDRAEADELSQWILANS